jgi:hypothetical protein
MATTTDTTAQSLIRLEHAAWQALSTSGHAAATFYEAVLAPEVLVLLPGPMVIDDRSAVIDSMRGEPWSSFHLSNERVLELTDDVAVLAYEVEARRGATEYRALLNSTYVRSGDGSWKLALHQQTPAG